MKHRAFLLTIVLFAAGCASSPIPASWQQKQTVRLTQCLVQLDQSVDPAEAACLAETAVTQAAALAVEFRAVRPAWVGNFYINNGLRERGLCYHWANALYPRLYALRSHTLELHLAVSAMDTSHEHNCIVVTARRQPFNEGVLLDAWRHSGRLYFVRAADDNRHWGPLPRDRVAPELDRLVPK